MENKVLKEKFVDQRTGIEYRLVGDYYIPNITIPKARRTENIGKYGKLKLNYMKKYKIPEYTEMLLSNELKSYLLDIEDECKEKLDILIKQMAEKAEMKKIYKQINKLVKDKKIKFSFYNSNRATLDLLQLCHNKDDNTIEILTDTNLSDKEKHSYSIIMFLSKKNKYCYCTNSNISELLNISITQVSKLVNSLKKKEYNLQGNLRKNSIIMCQMMITSDNEFFKKICT